MRRVLIIGIGAGDPEQVTVQAIKALNQADVFFVIDKGADKQDLMLLRQEICERYVENSSYRMVHAPDPERDRAAAPYRPAVQEWRRQRSEIYERLIAGELADGQCGAFLVWGDPALYDSTLAIIEQIVDRGALELEYEVIPGISSVQALAARHRVSLTQVGRPVHVTTGRRLAEGFPEDCDDVVVMLDAACSFSGVAEPDIQIYWGAYIGTKDEILVSGTLGEVGEEIQAVRAEARARKGWIMDTYLLRRTGRMAVPADILQCVQEIRARHVVDKLRERGINAHLARAGVDQFGISVALPGGREAQWDTDGAIGLEAVVLQDGNLVGFVPKIAGSERFGEDEVVDAIARTDYDQPVARLRPEPTSAGPPLPPAGGLFRRFLDGFRYR